jgi:neurotransmitter:Na+ symporter, NSS family
MLFVAAITSSMSMLQPAIAFFEEGFGMGRRLSVTCLSMLGAFGALLVVYFSKGLLALGTMDFWIGSVCIFLLATVQVILAGWVFGVRRLRAEASRGAALKIPSIFWFIIKYVSPTYLLAIFGLWCYYNLPQQIDTIRNMSSEDRGTVLLILTFLGSLLIFFCLLINLAAKRWKAEGKLDAAAEPAFPDVRSPARQRSNTP